MKRYGIIFCALSSATVLALAACGGGGGGGGGGGAGVLNQPFTNAITLQGPGADDAVPAPATVSAATSINNPAAGDRLEIVGMADDANVGLLQPVVWDFAPNAIAVIQVPPTPPSVNPTPANGIPAADLIPEDLPGLGTPTPGEFGAAFGNNNIGEIVGQSEDGPIGPVRAVLWSAEPVGGGPRTITALDAANEGAAFDINNNGLVVGEKIVAGVTTPVVYDADAVPVTAVDLPLGTATAGSAAFINDENVIVGEVTDAAGVTKAAVWKPITTTPARTDYNAPILLSGIPATPATPTAPAKPALAGDSVALAISPGANGVVVGEITDAATGMVHAVRWPSATDTAVPRDLGANSSACGINGGGRIVGSAGNAASAWNALAAAPVTMHTALTNGRSSGINNASKAVGAAGGLAFFATP